MQESAAGVVFLLALLNAWLASRRGRSGLRWFLGSLILAPLGWLLTLYLLTRPAPLTSPIAPSPVWGWIKLTALVGVALILVFTIFLPSHYTASQSGAEATAQPRPVQAP
jgi:hypothetical protein